jgi:hypothetical protein
MGIETALIAATIASTAAAVYNGNKAANAQEDATNQATKNAKTTADAATEANNKANQKRPDGSALLSANQAAAKAGQSGTMLTGPTGVDPSMLSLGKTTLLGGGG